MISTRRPLDNKTLLHAKFSRVILIRSSKEPQSQKTQMASHHWPKTTSPENPNPNNPIQEPSPNPQTTLNEQNWERNTKNSPWKNIASWICSIREYNIGWYIIISSSNAMNSDIRYWSIIKNLFHMYLLKSNNWENISFTVYSCLTRTKETSDQ